MLFKSGWVKMKKLIAPIVGVVLTSAFVILELVGVFMIPSTTVRFIALIIAGAIIAGLLYVLWQRYKEIKSGFEDDIDKY